MCLGHIVFVFDDFRLRFRCQRAAYVGAKIGDGFFEVGELLHRLSVERVPLLDEVANDLVAELMRLTFFLQSDRISELSVHFVDVFHDIVGVL